MSKSKTSINILALFCVILMITHPIKCHSLRIHKTAQINIYYDTISGVALNATSNADHPAHYQSDGGDTRLSANQRPVAFRSNGCSCQSLTCGCCTGINIQQFQFNREGCMNFTYDPDEFALTMDAFMNNNVVFTNKFSAKNPPPLCFPVEVPFLPSVHFCAKMFDIHTPGQNLHMCLDFETRIQYAPVLVLHFNCMRMGSNGFALVKPGESLPTSSSTSTTIVPIVDLDEYDEVTEDRKKKRP